ncbi:N-acetylglutamate synthase, GNAT family [Natronoarchaeum philippinense]|uniref:N-acetylglutamate synthase, GNAT family n=1 Tax=Natronoarchaeum philippinense TaxID=558529 RepID=A0A285N676_NATPI|nr:GNAT family N-acetyltransferase [Natronoarchaeum philippinense]SNZ04919.1 N-acetylglutamate synthase, GNAT family [Natronoarchaeum philippinense]
MYVRDAKNREEVWLLDHIEEMGLDATSFRSRDYVIAIDEQSGTKAGFGRIRIHKSDDGELCELTSIGVLTGWREQGVGAHVLERLLEQARDQGFERVYSLTDEPTYLAQFGFRSISAEELPEKLQERLDAKRDRSAPEATPVVVDVDEFEMPDRLRERFKYAAEEAVEEAPDEMPEDFGIDSETATYKYDTGR